MARISLGISRFNVVRTVPQVLALDIGSRFTKIAMNGKVVFLEPTQVVYHRGTEVVISSGEAAAKQEHGLSQDLSTLFPIEYGRVAQQQMLAEYLTQAFAKVIIQPKFSVVPSAIPVKLALPVELTQLQKKLYFDSLRLARLQVSGSTAGVLAALRAAQSENLLATTGILVDIGAMQTQISVIIGGELKHAARLQWGGKNLTQLVQKIVRDRYQTEINWSTAEQIKHSIGTLKPDKKESLPHLVVRGRNSVTNMHASLTLKASEFSEELFQAVLGWLTDVSMVLGTFPGSQIAEAFEAGIMMYGGGSLLKGLRLTIQKVLHTSVSRPTRPQTIVVEFTHHVTESNT